MLLKGMNAGDVALPGLVSHDCSLILPIYPRVRAKRKPTRGDGGLINHVTGLRVLTIIEEHCPSSRDVVHELQIPGSERYVPNIDSNVILPSRRAVQEANWIYEYPRQGKLITPENSLF
jgi:hypothetical protein